MKFYKLPCGLSHSKLDPFYFAFVAIFDTRKAMHKWTKPQWARTYVPYSNQSMANCLSNYGTELWTPRYVGIISLNREDNLTENIPHEVTHLILARHKVHNFDEEVICRLIGLCTAYIHSILEKDSELTEAEVIETIKINTKVIKALS